MTETTRTTPDGMEFIGNVPRPLSEHDDIDDGDNAELFRGLRAKYRFIETRDAFDRDGNPLPDYAAVYVK